MRAQGASLPFRTLSFYGLPGPNYRLLPPNHSFLPANDSLAGANHTRLRHREMETKDIYLIISEKDLSSEKVLQTIWNFTSSNDCIVVRKYYLPPQKQRAEKPYPIFSPFYIALVRPVLIAIKTSYVCMKPTLRK